MATLPLGQSTQYPDQYDPSLLFPIPRTENRAKLGLKEGQALPFVGVDIWNAFELSWLNQKGKPQIALAEFQIPADSPNLIESKSFKLYLNSLNNARFEDEDQVKNRLITDLSAVAGSKVSTRINPTEAVSKKGMQEMGGILMDRLDIEIDPHLPADPSLLGVNESFGPIEQCLVSHLLKSNCPVTGNLRPILRIIILHPPNYRAKISCTKGSQKKKYSFEELRLFQRKGIFCDGMYTKYGMCIGRNC